MCVNEGRSRMLRRQLDKNQSPRIPMVFRRNRIVDAYIASSRGIVNANVLSF